MSDLKIGPRDELGIDELESHQDCIRAANARDAYVNWRMRDVPAIYLELMPVTSDAKELWTAEKAIRAQVAEDFKLLSRPWHEIGPAARILDLSSLTAQERMEFSMSLEPFCGMPAVVKEGAGPDGVLWRNHPDVKRAQEDAPRTAEWACVEKVESLNKAAQEASSAYVAAANSGADRDEVSALEAEYNRALKAMQEAEEIAGRLRRDRIAACAIYRGLDDAMADSETD